MEAVLASHGISMDLNQDGVVGLTEGQVADELTEEEQAQVDEMIQVEKDNITSKPSRAFQVARALNPEPSVSDEAMAKANELADELEEFEQKIEETKKSFKEWDEENKQESYDSCLFSSSHSLNDFLVSSIFCSNSSNSSASSFALAIASSLTDGSGFNALAT